MKYKNLSQRNSNIISNTTLHSHTQNTTIITKADININPMIITIIRTTITKDLEGTETTDCKVCHSINFNQKVDINHALPV